MTTIMTSPIRAMRAAVSSCPHVIVSAAVTGESGTYVVHSIEYDIHDVSPDCVGRTGFNRHQRR